MIKIWYENNSFRGGTANVAMMGAADYCRLLVHSGIKSNPPIAPSSQHIS